MPEILDYSKEVKWNDVRRKFLRFESAPDVYGADLRSFKLTELDDLDYKFVPDEAEKKLQYFKDIYWEKSSQFYFPISSAHFLSYCYLGSMLTDKSMLQSCYKYLEVGLSNDFSLSPKDRVKDVNLLCERYDPLLFLTYFQATLKENLTKLNKYETLKDQIDLWKFRNFALV